MMNPYNKNILQIIIFSSLSIFCVSCSQTSTGIYKTYSFYKINTPGTIPVDDNGNAIGKIHDTTFVIYFETKKDEQPKLLGASFNGNFYKLNLFQQSSTRIEVGNRLPDNKPVVIKTGSNRQLWKTEIGAIINANTGQTKNKTLLAILVEYEGRKASRFIKKHTELVPELHY